MENPSLDIFNYQPTILFKAEREQVVIIPYKPLLSFLPNNMFLSPLFGSGQSSHTVG